MPDHPINVLVVDDSAVARDLLQRVLQSDPAIHVIGTARNGTEAIAALAGKKPDVMTMDIHMPGMDGFEATRRIMETQPLPIVIVTASYNPADVEQTFRAMEAGALAVVEKPPGTADPQHGTAVLKLLNTVKAMSEVRVIRRWPKVREGERSAEPLPVVRAADEIRLVAIGASTGGPPVLRSLLKDLPKPFPVPVLIVQHISAGFVQGLVDWLNATSGMSVHLARHAERPQAGHAYVAPDGCHLCVNRDGNILCLQEEPENGLRPAVARLFRSVAEHFGPHAVGVLLTGMGSDGAVELKLMRDRGAVTIAQDKESSIIHGMPGEAIRLGAATHVGSPPHIAALLRSLVQRGPSDYRPKS